MENVFVKLCDVDIDISIVNFGLKIVFELFDIDNLLFVLIMEEMVKCTNIIFNIIFKIMKDNKEVIKSKVKNDFLIFFKIEILKEMCF